MGRQRKPRAPKNPVASALAQLRWAKATTAQKKAVGKTLAEARWGKKKGRRSEK